MTLKAVVGFSNNKDRNINFLKISNSEKNWSTNLAKSCTQVKTNNKKKRRKRRRKKTKILKNKGPVKIIISLKERVLFPLLTKMMIYSLFKSLEENQSLIWMTLRTFSHGLKILT